MELTLDRDRLIIHLTPIERLWAFHLGRSIAVPLDTIDAIRTDMPQGTWRELRAPGTFLPGVIKAGTYYTDRGREFWYATGDRGNNFLDLTLRGGYYKRIVLTVEEAAGWRDRLEVARRDRHG